MMRGMVLSVVFFCSLAHGQGVYTGVLAGSSALGSGISSLWGELAYPASMRKAAVAAGVFGERRFMSDLAFCELGFRFGLGKQPVQIHFTREGNAHYSDLRSAVALVKNIDNAVALALKLGYDLTAVQGYPSRGSAVAGLGVFFRMSEQLNWAIQADGVNRFFSKNNKGNFLFRSGLGYRVSELASLSLEVFKENEYPVQFLAAISYAFSGHFSANLGYAPPLSSFLLGVSFHYENVSFQVTTGLHTALGASGGFSVVYQLKEKAR